MRSLLILLICLATTAFAQRKESDEPVVRLAKAMLLNSDEASLAKNYFDSMTKKELMALLEPVLVKTEVGSDAYTASSYVLAYYNVRPELYVRYMLCQYDKWSVGMESETGTLTSLPRAVSYFFQRDKDSYSLHALLEMKLKGKGITELHRERTQVFLQRPEAVVAEAAKDPKLVKNLGESLAVTTQTVERRQALMKILSNLERNAQFRKVAASLRQHLTRKS